MPSSLFVECFETKVVLTTTILAQTGEDFFLDGFRDSIVQNTKETIRKNTIL